MEDNTLDRVRCWTNPDNSIQITYYVRNAMKKKGEMNPSTGLIMDHDETEDEFIERVDNKIRREIPEYQNFHSTLNELSSLPSMEHRSKFKRTLDNSIIIDHSFKTQSDIHNEKVLKLKSKFKDLGFSNEEIELLIN